MSPCNKVTDPSMNVTQSKEKEKASSIEDIELERIYHQLKSNYRHKIFQDILLNDLGPTETLKYLGYGIGSILITMLSTSLISLIPAHDVILDPSYWFECPLHFG